MPADLLSKNNIKFLKSLHLKKYRQKYSQFLVEGPKSVQEVSKSAYEVEHIYGLDEKVLENIDKKIGKTVITESEMQQISYFKSAPPCLALVHFKKEIQPILKGWSLLLDHIQDPGNLGTILRIADWFNIAHVYLSNDTVDLYNPKVISSSMASFSRVPISVINNITEIEEDLPIYAADMAGISLNTMSSKTKPGVIIIGNEGQGIREHWLNLASQTISIPKLGEAESLNAGVAAGIICYHINNLK